MTQTTPETNAEIRREWSLGSYPAVGRSFVGMAAELVDAADVGSGTRVLDVACGTGNAALTARRRGARVTGVDLTPAMLDVARERATVVDADVDWREGDAAALPFDDDGFDVTLSCLGHVFVPDASAAGDELVRVTRPGGRLAFTSWTPDGGIAAMVAVLSEYLPPRPEAAPPPFRWGDPATVRDRLGDEVENLAFDRGVVRYPAVSPAHFWDRMTRDSGPIVAALEDVAERDRPALDESVVDALDRFFDDGDNAVALSYRLGTATVP